MNWEKLFRKREFWTVVVIISILIPAFLKRDIWFMSVLTVFVRGLINVYEVGPEILVYALLPWIGFVVFMMKIKTMKKKSLLLVSAIFLILLLIGVLLLLVPVIYLILLLIRVL